MAASLKLQGISSVHYHGGVQFTIPSLLETSNDRGNQATLFPALDSELHDSGGDLTCTPSGLIAMKLRNSLAVDPLRLADLNQWRGNSRLLGCHIVGAGLLFSRMLSLA